MSVPTTPPAPARLSTNTVCPSFCPSCWATIRPTMSLLPPGGNGMISRIGRDGESSAAAGLRHAKVRDKRPRTASIDARDCATDKLRLMLAAAAGGIKNSPGRRRIVQEFCRRPHRPRQKVAAAIGAHAFEALVDAVAAEGALESADHRVGGGWRQILVAAFAAWPQFEHSQASLYLRRGPAITVSHQT